MSNLSFYRIRTTIALNDNLFCLLHTDARSRPCRRRITAWNDSCLVTRRACRWRKAGPLRTRMNWIRWMASEAVVYASARWTIRTINRTRATGRSTITAARQCPWVAAVALARTIIRCSPITNNITTTNTCNSITTSITTTRCRHSITTMHEAGCRSTRPTAIITRRTTVTRTAAVARPRGRRWPATR